jgi:hypothetical protein
MRFKSARDLKSEITSVSQLEHRRQERGVSIGIAPTELVGEYRLAIRVSEQHPEAGRLIDEIASLASGEVDIRVSGKIVTDLPAVTIERRRILSLGSSVAHYRSSVGTLGFFARKRDSRVLGFVSCNHTLAAQDEGLDGDDVLCPAPADRGTRSRDVVAHLDGSYARLRGDRPIDCAFARITTDVAYEPVTIQPGEFLSSHSAIPAESRHVEKIGRTTGRTRGRITAFDLDNVKVQYSFGTVRFARQIEVTSIDERLFSRPGDSGALVFTDAFRPLGLIYASTAGGLAYVHPIDAVTDALGIDFVS